MSKERWVAFITDGAEPDTWRANADGMRGGRSVEAVVCDHKHKTREAAVKCAKELAAKQADRIAL